MTVDYFFFLVWEDDNYLLLITTYFFRSFWRERGGFLKKKKKKKKKFGIPSFAQRHERHKGVHLFFLKKKKVSTKRHYGGTYMS